MSNIYLFVLLLLALTTGSPISDPMWKAMGRKEEQKFPPQSQDSQPGKQYLMHPLPISFNPQYQPSNKLHRKVALVTGGDSGIGRAVCYYFALEGATVAFTYVKGAEDKDTDDALSLIREAAKASGARDPIAIPADLRGEGNCKAVVDEVVSHFGRIDVLVNNAGVQYYQQSIEDITEEQLRNTYEINFFAYFFMAKHALKHMKNGSSIINTASVLGYIGRDTLLDYSTTKGAIVTFTKSLALQLIKQGIRVNGVAPGPIWTPLEVASLPVDEIVIFGSEAPMDRAGQPYELAPSYVFLASNECSSYFTGQFLHPNGAAHARLSGYQSPGWLWIDRHQDYAQLKCEGVLSPWKSPHVGLSSIDNTSAFIVN